MYVHQEGKEIKGSNAVCTFILKAFGSLQSEGTPFVLVGYVRKT